MGGFACPCGSGFRDGPDFAPHKGHLISDQDFEDFQQAQQAGKWNVAYWHVKATVWQCPACSRLHFHPNRDTGPVPTFAPEAEAAGLLRSVWGEEWKRSLRARWEDSSGSGNVWWGDTGTKEGDNGFVELSSWEDVEKLYYEVFRRLSGARRLRSALLQRYDRVDRNKPQNLHYWSFESAQWGKHLLLGCKGCGNTIVEAAFAVAGVPLDYEEVDYSADSPTRARLLEVNPLGQVPALVLSDGSVLTESLAILQYLDDLKPNANLIPKGDATRKHFYRWAVFLVAAVYPTFTYGDEPEKWVADAAGAKMLRESTDAHRKALWKQVEAAAGERWFLGERFSALDLYITVMTRWRPGRKWFEANTPRLVAIAEKAAAIPEVAPVLARNFG